jgi:hypothetical protein
VIAALLRDQTDSTFIEGDALQKAFPGVPVLANIPQLTAGAGEGYRVAAYGRFRRS